MAHPQGSVRNRSRIPGRIDSVASRLRKVRSETPGAGLDLPLRLHRQVVGAVYGERDERQHARQHGVPVQDAGMGADLEVGPQGLEEVAVRPQRHAADDVADRRAEEDREEEAGEREDEIAQRPSQRIVHVGPDLDADPPQHEQPEHHHQRQIEAAEARRVEEGEREIEGAASRQQPDLVAVPDRSDGALDQTPLAVPFRHPGSDDPDPEVESVQHHVRGQHQRDEQEPERFHGAVLLNPRPFRSGNRVRASAPARGGAGTGCSAGSTSP
jgi:hypothetical protein